MVRIGFGDIGFYDKRYCRTIISNFGKLIFKGEAFIGEGAKISCGRNGTIIFGSNFRNSGALTLCCEKLVLFYENVLVGWNTTILDSDYHSIFMTDTRRISKNTLPVVIGNNVWIAINAIVLKGTSIPDGAIIGAGAVIHGQYQTPNVLLIGNPAVCIKKNVTRYIENTCCIN